MSSGAGCTIIAAWTPAKAPRSSSRIFPPPFSSAGVPTTVTVRPTSSAMRARARPAPTALAAITLCPHAWPISGRQSYSAHTATCSGPEPARARNAVGRSQMPRSTRKPPASSSSPIHAAARSSSKPSSGVPWMRCESPTSASRAPSMRSRAAAFASIARIVLTLGEKRQYSPPMYDGLRVIDADAHKMENPVVFFDYFDPAYRDRLGSRVDRYGQQRLVIHDFNPATGRNDLELVFPQPDGPGKGAFAAIHPEPAVGGI